MNMFYFDSDVNFTGLRCASRPQGETMKDYWIQCFCLDSGRGHHIPSIRVRNRNPVIKYEQIKTPIRLLNCFMILVRVSKIVQRKEKLFFYSK